MQFKEIKSVSFNCLGFKSSSAFIDNLCIEYDICFLYEHWLEPLELPFVKSLYKDKNIWSHLKSSVDPESVSSGRPHGGVGFLCKESGDVTYRVLGVYMPFYTGSSEQTELYIETLDLLQEL